MRVIVVGEGELGSSIMMGVLESSHELVGVMRWKKMGRKDQLRNFLRLDYFQTLIKANKIYEIKAEKVNSDKFIKEAIKLQPDIILVGSWGEILKKQAIILPKVACVNCHPSLLPKHRGGNPYASAILQGEAKTGITFHLINEGIDSGPILIQKELSITPDDTGDSLRRKCAYRAKETVKELLDGLENGNLNPKAQDESKATYFPRLSEKDVRISWNKPAHTIHNQIRGLHPWAQCYTRHENEFLMIGSSKIIELEQAKNQPGIVLSKTNKGLLVSTADPYKALFVDNLYVYGLGGKLWSPIYFDKKIKVGDQLINI